MRYSLYQNGRRVHTFFAEAASEWEVDLSEFPLLDGSGTPYEYSLQKYSQSFDFSPAYRSEMSVSDGVCLDVETFAASRDLISTVVWDDMEDYFGYRPGTLAAENCSVYYDGSFSITASSAEKNEDGSYTVIYRDVPSYYTAGGTYVIAAYPKYRYSDIPSSYTMTSAYLNDKREVTQTFSLRSYKVTANCNMYTGYNGNTTNNPAGWLRADELGIPVPDVISFTLLNNGEPADCPEPTKTVVRNENGGFQTGALIWRLPRVDMSGRLIDYSGLSIGYSPDLSKGELPGNYRQQQSIYTYSDSFSFTLNTYLPMIYAVNLTAVWDDNGNAAGVRPNGTGIALKANGETVDLVSPWIVPADRPTTSMSNYAMRLPMLDADGDPILYTVDAANLPAYYTLSAAESPPFLSDTGYTTANSVTLRKDLTLSMLTQKVIADVVWNTDGSSTELNNRPSAVALKLYCSADGGATWNEFWGRSVWSVSAHDGWHAEWDLPACDANGAPLLFRVTQNPLSLYETSFSESYGGEGTYITVTNDYTTAWDYAIDLMWDTDNLAERFEQSLATAGSENIVKRAVLVINANHDYEEGQLSVRIPYAAVIRRDGRPLVPEISLPQAPAVNSAYSFNYSIDRHDSDDPADWEIVFTNWEAIESGYNLAISLRYTIPPFQLTDCTTISIVASGRGQSVSQTSPTYKRSNTITFRLDTGISCGDFSKKLPSAGGAQRTGRVYCWDTTYGPEPEGFDPNTYNYVVYEVINETNILYNQPYRIEFIETPGQNGRVVQIWSQDSWRRMTLDEATGVWKTAVRPSWTTGSGGWEYGGAYSRPSHCWYITVAYPRSEMPPPPAPGEEAQKIIYDNTINIRMIAVDEHEGDKGPDDLNDVLTFTRSQTAEWVDYSFQYSGWDYSVSKSMGTEGQGLLSALEYGGDAFFRVTCYGTLNGYNFEDGYRFELFDDALYLQARIDGTQTDYRKLTWDEYSFSSKSSDLVTYVRIGSSDIDRTNGLTVAGMVPEEPFVLLGRKLDGTWEEITRITMTTHLQTTHYIPAALIDGKGYNALKLISPDGLTGKFDASLVTMVRLSAESAAVRDYLAAGASDLWLTNFDGLRMFVMDDEGTEHWHNPAIFHPQLTEKTGLREDDIAEFGAEVSRSGVTVLIRGAQKSSAMRKVMQSAAYSAEHSKVDVRFALFARETINSTQLPAELYKDWSADRAVFYDLLPLGYRFRPSSGVEVYGAGNMEDLNTAKPAFLYTAETIDDYMGTGRQLLIFRVETAAAAGENYYLVHGSSVAYTGFAVCFTATISYEDLGIYGTGENAAIYQRGDLCEIAGGFPENGYGPYEGRFPINEAGQYILRDINGDGDTEAPNSLYALLPVALDPLTTMQTGIRKTVKASGDLYSVADVADLGSTYSYRLRVETSDRGQTSGLILTDILETALNRQGWQGEFVDVNVGAARAMGIDVKVYYSPDDLAYSDEEDMKLDSGHWYPLTPETDRSTVKALAFDMTTKLDGTPMTFIEDAVVNVDITMRAPAGLQPQDAAFNQAGYWCSYRPIGSMVTTREFLLSGVTSVTLRNLQDLVVFKAYPSDAISADAPLQKLSGVKFELYRCGNGEPGHTHTGLPGSASSCWGATPVYTAVTDYNGLAAFRGLDSGTYAFIEASVPNGVQRLTYRYWVFEVDARTGTVTEPAAMSSSPNAAPPVPLTYIEETGHWQLINRRTERTIYVRKTWTDGGTEFRTPVTFELYRNGELIAEKVMPVGAVSVRFDGLFVFDTFGRRFEYSVREVPVDGYTADSESITITDTNTSSTVNFRNTRLGVIEVRKKLSGSDSDASFPFTLKLGPPKGEALPEVVPVTLWHYAGENDLEGRRIEAFVRAGVLEFSLRGGERVVILGLPLNSEYEVTEDSGSYTSVVSEGSARGATTSSGVGRMTFTNTPKPTALTLKIKKSVTGPVPTGSAETFSFVLTPIDGAPMPESDKITITGEGEATFGEISFTSAGTFTYTVSEEKGTAAGYTYDETAYRVTAEVTDNGGTLSAVWKTDGEPITGVVFENVYKPSAASLSLRVRKSVTGPVPPGSAETFGFVLTPIDGAPMPESDKITITGEGEATFGEISFTSAGTFTYTVSEEKGTAAGYTYDETAYRVTAEVTDNGGTLSAVWKTDGEPITGVVFENVYKPSAASLSLRVRKSVTGPVPTGSAVTFSFILTPIDGAPMPESDKVTITGEGEASFGEIEYVLEGTYRYEIREEGGEAPGYVYDDTVREIVVTVMDVGGRLEAVRYVDEVEGADAEFTNDYRGISPISIDPKTFVSIPVRKILNGDPVPPGSIETFTFTISAKTPAPMPESDKITITGEGEASFGPVSYSIPGTYRYEIREEKGSAPGYVYDETVYEVTVTVTEESGELKSVWTTDGTESGTAVFENRYVAEEDTAVYGRLTVTKAVSGARADKTEEFEFRLRLSVPGHFPYVSGDKSGTISDGEMFTLRHGESITVSGIPAGADYSVEETDSKGYASIAAGAEGRITEGETVAEFVNTLDEIPLGGHPGGGGAADDPVGEGGIGGGDEFEEIDDDYLQYLGAVPLLGDGSMTALWLALSLASAVALLVLLLSGRRKKREK